MRASSKSHPGFVPSLHVTSPTALETRQALVAASVTSFILVLLLGVAAVHGWAGAAALDAPAAALREWAVERPWTEDLLLRAEVVLGYDGLTLATVALAGWLLLRRRLSAALLVVGVMFATKELTQLGKAWFGRERPTWQDADALLQSGSYTSAHASTVAAFAGLVVALTILGTRRAATRWLVAGAAAALVLVVCADRLLLGRHYPTDLLGGVLLGLGLVLLGVAVLPGLQVGTDDERDATPVGDAPLGERERVLSRSA